MAHIQLSTDSPGIRGLFEFRPETARPLSLLAETLLRGESTLTRGERELIATYVSHLNECHFCMSSHAAFAAAQLPDGFAAVDGVIHDPASAPISEKLQRLLAIAAEVQRSGKAVTTETIQAAREAGATDIEIHDTVLIAAAFCMFNRYVDGLATFAPPAREDYIPMAERIVNHGYVGSA
jgi:uncharacterized peroxidase-related enzyme